MTNIWPNQKKAQVKLFSHQQYLLMWVNVTQIEKCISLVKVQEKDNLVFNWIIYQLYNSINSFIVKTKTSYKKNGTEVR